MICNFTEPWIAQIKQANGEWANEMLEEFGPVVWVVADSDDRGFGEWRLTSPMRDPCANNGNGWSYWIDKAAVTLERIANPDDTTGAK